MPQMKVRTRFETAGATFRAHIEVLLPVDTNGSTISGDFRSSEILFFHEPLTPQWGYSMSGDDWEWRYRERFYESDSLDSLKEEVQERIETLRSEIEKVVNSNRLAALPDKEVQVFEI